MLRDAIYYKTERDSVVALLRYVPPQFAALSANNVRGLHSDFSWTRHITNRLDFATTFYNNNLVLPGLRETMLSGSANLHYRLSGHWSVNGGVIASTFQIKVPPSPAIRSLTLPASLAFQSKHFGVTGQYQFDVTPGRESGGNQYRSSVRSGWGAFTFTGYVERDTNAPTLNFIFGQVAGLQQLLDQMGIRATTVQQVDELLSSNSSLIAAGYIKGATINLIPSRTQIGGSADWSSRGIHGKQLSYSFLVNDNQMLLGSTRDVAQTLSYTQSITRADDLSLACSVLGTTNPGSAPEYSPVCFVGWRHQFQHVPSYIVPERHGTIAGNVFRDDRSKGVFEAGMQPMPSVEVTLDQGRRMLTRADGSYRFTGVPRGKHRIAVLYTSRAPYFYTTASDLEVDEEATVNFGIGHSLSSLMGRLLNDAGMGIAEVAVVVRNGAQRWSTETDAEGGFLVSSLVAGDYDVQVDEDSLPAGYADGVTGTQQVEVAAASPGQATFTAQALRSISGRVLSYDTKVGGYVPLIGSQVKLGEPGLITTTDATGRYLFRNLRAGSYGISVLNEESTRTVRLSDQPQDLTNVDFQLSRRSPLSQ